MQHNIQLSMSQFSTKAAGTTLLIHHPTAASYVKLILSQTHINQKYLVSPLPILVAILT